MKEFSEVFEPANPENVQKKVGMCISYRDEFLLEIQQLRFGLREVPVVTAQLKHPQQQHQRTVLGDRQNKPAKVLMN